MVVVLMGVAGAGKTTVGSALAGALGWSFVDADALHPGANIEKIRAGVPLTDRDRAPWLVDVRRVIGDAARGRTNLIVACSALRERYRATLREGVPDVRWVYLEADRDLLAARLETRRDHYAGPEILDSQLATLEGPRDALTLDAALPVPVLVAAICTELGLRPAAPPEAGG